MKAKIKIIAAMLIWGSMGLFVRNINLSSGEIALIRGVTGVSFLLVLCSILRLHITSRALVDYKLLLIASGIALSANWIFLFEAYKHTTIAITTLSYYLAPIIITVLSRLVLKEKLTVIKVICIITALVGIAFVSGVYTGSHQDRGNGLGIIYGVAAAISYASLTLMNKFIKSLTSIEATIAQLGVASMVLLPYTLLTRNSTDIILEGQTVILLITLGIIHTGLAFWLFFSAIKDLKAQTIAVLSYIDPVTAIALSALLLNENLGLAQIFGAFLILGSTLTSEILGNCNSIGRKNKIPKIFKSKL